MNRVSRLAFALGLSVASATVAAASAQQLPASPLRATLVIPDRTLLPGVPFDMWIDVHNPSAATISAGLFPTLLVDAGCESFELDSRCEVEVLPAGAGVLTLAPGQHTILTLPVWGVRGPVFFNDPRLSPPGNYELALRFDSEAGMASEANGLR
jgi:hypothetical protein